MKQGKLWLRIFFVVSVALLAAWLRNLAVRNLIVDYDEPTYLRAEKHYAEAIRAGDWAEITGYTYTYEHPPLAKLAAAVVMSQVSDQRICFDQPAAEYPPPDPSVEKEFYAARYTSLFFGVMNVLLVAIANPLAGLFLAIHTYAIKYTSQVYLDALAMLMGSIVVLAYVKSGRKWNGWMLLSAVALGLTAAAKYIHCVAGLAVVIDWLWQAYAAIEPGEKRLSGRRVIRWLGPVAGWGLLSIVTFLAANPYLWPDPVGRLRESVLYHVAYSQSSHVREAHHPFWRPLMWLIHSIPWHPREIFTRFDGITVLIGLLGIRRMWGKWPVMVIWWVVGMIFLLIWPTKWPHYILTVTVPVTLCAAEGLAQVREWLPARLLGREQQVAER